MDRKEELLTTIDILQDTIMSVYKRADSENDLIMKLNAEKDYQNLVTIEMFIRDNYKEGK